MASDFEKLPEWLKELWRLAPNIARQAEAHIKELEAQVAAQQSVHPTCGILRRYHHYPRPKRIHPLGIYPPRPQAGNANRWADPLPAITKEKK